MVFVVGSAHAGDEICFDFHETLLQRVITAYCAIYDYENNGGGLSQAKFAKSRIIHIVKRDVEAWEDKQDKDALPGNLLREPDPNNPGEYLEIE